MQMHSLAFDVSHTLAGGLVLISFLMLYQDRLYSLLNVFALHALVLALSVACGAVAVDQKSWASPVGRLIRDRDRYRFEASV